MDFFCGWKCKIWRIKPNRKKNTLTRTQLFHISILFQSLVSKNQYPSGHFDNDIRIILVNLSNTIFSEVLICNLCKLYISCITWALDKIILTKHDLSGWFMILKVPFCPCFLFFLILISICNLQSSIQPLLFYFCISPGNLCLLLISLTQYACCCGGCIWYKLNSFKGGGQKKMSLLVVFYY